MDLRFYAWGLHRGGRGSCPGREGHAKASSRGHRAHTMWMAKPRTKSQNQNNTLERFGIWLESISGILWYLVLGHQRDARTPSRWQIESHKIKIRFWDAWYWNSAIIVLNRCWWYLVIGHQGDTHTFHTMQMAKTKSQNKNNLGCILWELSQSQVLEILCTWSSRCHTHKHVDDKDIKI